MYCRTVKEKIYIKRQSLFFLLAGLLIVFVSAGRTTAQSYQCTDAIYFTSTGNTNVYRYTPSTNAITRLASTSVGSASAASAVMPGGTRLYSVDGVTPFRLRYNSGGTTNAIAASTSSTSTVQRNAIAPDGTGYFMVGTAALAGQYYRYTTGGATSTVTGPFTFTLQPATAPAIVNGGDIAIDATGIGYLIDQGKNFYRLDFTGNVATFLGTFTGMGTESPNGLGFTSINTAGNNFLYASTLNNRLYRLNIATMAATLVTPSSTVGGFTQNDIASCIYPPAVTASVAAVKAWRNVTKGDPTNFTVSTAANAGDTIEYRVIVRNTGVIAAGNTTLQDTIPSGLTYTAATTTLNGAAVTDSAGTGNAKFPYQIAANIKSPGLGVGVLGVDSTAAITTDNEATIIFRATVNNPFNGAANPIPNTAQVNYTGSASAVNSNTVNTPVSQSGIAITPDAGTRPSVVAGQATALFNFRVSNTGNFTDQVRFLALGASARVTGPAIITDIVIDTDGSQTIGAPDTDIKNNPADVLSASVSPNGFINVIVRVLVNLTAVQGDAITVTLGDAATGDPAFDDQAADSSANEVRTVSTASTNGLREARGDMTALVDNDAQIFVNITAPSGPVPLGSDITYTLDVSNPGLRLLTGQTLTNAPAGSNTGIFIINPIPVGTVLKAGQVFPAGTLYTTSPLSTDPLTAVWTTTPPADLTTLKRIAFNVGATLAPMASSANINLTVTITTNDATNPIQAIADAFGHNSLSAALTDQTGDISRTVGDGNANFDEGPLRGTIDGDGVIQLTTLQAVGGVLLGPLGQPGAVGSDNNDDYTNRSVTDGIAGVAPGGTTTEDSTIIFTNTLQNTGNANDTFTLTAPTVPAGFSVEISPDGGASYTTVSGGGSVTVGVGVGSQTNILVRITAPPGEAVLTAYATTIRATSGNDNAVFNETIDRLYTGYLRILKSQVVTNGTSVGSATDAVAGAEIAYTISFTNISSSGGTNNSTLIVTNFVLTDPIPSNVDFKLNSVTSNLGTTGLTVAVDYSDDDGASYEYTPTDGAGGAPAGYDRTVTHIRWTFTGNLEQTAPANSGSIGFTVYIR